MKVGAHATKLSSLCRSIRSALIKPVRREIPAGHCYAISVHKAPTLFHKTMLENDNLGLRKLELSLSSALAVTAQ